MYVYDQHDQKIIDERVAQFRDQTTRFLAGEITDGEFLPLRLQNGPVSYTHLTLPTTPYV